MPVNRDQPDLWKGDIAQSVDMYNEWFMSFAPAAFRETRKETTVRVERDLSLTNNLLALNAVTLRAHPEVLPTLRMSACPPIAVDRLIGLAGVSSSLVDRIEKDQKLPLRMADSQVDVELAKLASVLSRLVDPDIFVWLNRAHAATPEEIYRAATIVADRLCGAVTNPIIRNAQERRQLALIKQWLEQRGYTEAHAGVEVTTSMPHGTFAFRRNVAVKLGDAPRPINIPIDVVIQPLNARDGSLPLLFEAKSAGDFANVNKRRKEEAAKMQQLRATFGQSVSFNLFLCGYFDSGYLGYEAAEGIDWVWEHRIDDFQKFGV